MIDKLQLLRRESLALKDKANEITAKLDQLIEVVNTVPANNNFLQLLTILILSSIVGYYVVWKVTPALHTPLMAVTNAISGIIIIGGLTSMQFSTVSISFVAGIIAVFLAAINIFGGFVVTYRMLSMFNRR